MLETSSYSPKIKKQPLIVLLQAMFWAKKVADRTKFHTVATCIDKQEFGLKPQEFGLKT